MKSITTSIRIAFICAGILAFQINGFSWGQKGHDVTASIAQEHLTKKAGRQISAILDGKSLVYWANWLDDASHTPEFAYTKTWHYKNVDAGFSLENAPLNKNGDVLTAISAQIEALRGGELDKEQEALALKMLIHLVGDLHCPMHMGHLSDLGGNKWQVQYFGKGKNLHEVWDSGVIESAHSWSRSEWTKELDILNRKEAKAICAGTPEDWAAETLELATAIYDGTPKGSKLSFDYVREWAPVVEEQVLKGGLRLAALLNAIFR